jgi:hypothetical protein
MAKLKNRLTFMPSKDITAFELSLLVDEAIGRGQGIYVNDDDVFKKYPELKRHFHDRDNACTLEEE